MSNMELAGLVLGSIPLALDAARLSSQIAYNAFDIITLRALRRSFVELKQDYGVLQAALLVFIFPDARHVLERIQRHLLEPQLDEVSAMEEAMALKKSMADDCSMLAVAAAIVAQVAITALSLDSLSTVHWTAKAAFVLSLAAGALSVFFACLLQQRVSSMFGLSDLKDWLSKPAGNKEFREAGILVRGFKEARHKLAVDATIEPKSEHVLEPWLEVKRGLRQLVNERRWVHASFSAALMIKIPSLLLNWSVGALLVGLGVYLGSFWTDNLDSSEPHSSSLGVLVAYIIITATGLLLFFIPLLLKHLEGAPIRRLKERLVEQERPNDKPPGLDVDDIFDDLDQEPDCTHTIRPKPSEKTDVDKFYQVPPNESNPSIHHTTATVDVGTQKDDEDSSLPEQDSTQKRTMTFEPTRKAESFRSPHLKKATTNIDRLAAVRRATEPARLQADPLVASLEASILAQERSIESFRALLQEHQRLLGVRRRVLS